MKHSISIRQIVYLLIMINFRMMLPEENPLLSAVINGCILACWVVIILLERKNDD